MTGNLIQKAKKIPWQRFGKWRTPLLMEAISAEALAKPHSEIISAARGKQLFQGWNIPDYKEKATRLFQAIWDPRKEIPQEAFKI